MFLEGLHASIKPMVSQYRQDNSDISFLRLVNYAKAHGGASRAKDKKAKRVTIQAPATLRVGSKPKISHPVRKIAPQFIWQLQFQDRRDAVRQGATTVIMKELLSPKAILLVHRMKTDTEMMGRLAHRQCRLARIRKARIRKPQIPC